jgi:two-component system invasion response regulator UvrY
MNPDTRILLIEDHEIVLWALTEIIEQRIPNAQIHTVPTFEHGLSYLEKNTVSLIVLDIDVPGGNSPKMITLLREIQPQVRILIHTGMDEENFAVKYLTAGADGFLSKKAPFSAIGEAMLTVMDGKKYMSLETQNFIAQSYLKNPYRKVTSDYNSVAVTPRERQILCMLLKGNWTKEIAGDLGIKWSTVSSHKIKIMEKFDVKNVIELYKKIERDYPELLNSDVVTSK